LSDPGFEQWNSGIRRQEEKKNKRQGTVILDNKGDSPLFAPLKFKAYAWGKGVMPINPLYYKLIFSIVNLTQRGAIMGYRT
jgi:hypothetical protein